MTAGRGVVEGDLREFVLAGSADFTVENAATGGRFTFRVRAPRKETERGGLTTDFEARVRFVSVLTGPENSGDFTYLGTIFDGRDYRPGKRSRIGADAPSSRAFRWLWARLAAGRPLHESVRIYHEGRCARCGRKLTVPESIRTGFGPECAGRIAGAGGCR
jgi:hypothetical protein